MEIDVQDTQITIDKEINNLDTFVFEFTKLLQKLNVTYTIISGYIAILFGRSRNTEDVDMFIERIDEEKFKELWNQIISQGFWCINTDSKDTAYEILKDNSSIRFAIKEHLEPNMEIKFAKTSLDLFSLRNRIRVNIKTHYLYTSPLEIQIAFKMYLGSDKDIEDARHLWIIFKKYIEREKLKYFANQLEVKSEVFQHVTREL